MADNAAACWQRGHDQAGVQRQSAAFQASGDRRDELADITCRTLVIHGDTDIMTKPAGGIATAAAIPNARYLEYPGLSHDLPRGLWPQIITELATLTGAAATPTAES